MGMSRDAREDLWIWSNLVEAVRALDAVTDCLPPDEDDRAWALFREVDQLRADVERRIFSQLGLPGARPYRDFRR
ncbi:hypothetical protein GCM10009872_51800 [Actinopolymorpha rutila]